MSILSQIKSWRLYILITVVLAVLMAVSLADRVFAPDKATVVNLNAKAEEVVALCAQASHRPKCYDEEIPKLMDAGMSMEDAFAVTATIQDLDPSYQYCHVLGHELSAKETAKDPSRWKDVVARSPLGMCSNGGVHGAFQERFRVEHFDEDEDYTRIVPELEGVCKPREGWEPTRMGQATCVHALGHLTMYVTNADINKALELCDLLLADDQHGGEKQLCYDGAFMQIYQPLEPEDFALIEGKEIETKEESAEFCATFDGGRRGSCVSESWPLYHELMQEPDTIKLICERANFDDWQFERCMNGVFYVAMAQSNLSVEWVHDFCPRMSEEYRGMCYGNSASRLIEVDSRNIDKALELCVDAADEPSRTACFSELLRYSDYTFLPGSEEFFALCNGMPTPWQGRCLRREKI